MSDVLKTRSGLTVQEVYTQKNVPEPLESSLGVPGQYPFTRGVQPNMYRGRLWTMRQYAGFGTAEEANERYKYLLSQGTMGLSVAFDLPTQLGFDPDHQRAKGEVGKVGVSVSTLDDMKLLFKDIPLAKVSTSMTINATAPILLAFYIAVAEEQGADRKDLRGTVQNDVLKEYIARGNYIYPPKGALRLITDMFSWCSTEMPKWNPISISGYHIREAGSNAIQELAFTFANAIAYVESALKAGLDIDDFAGQLSFFFNVHSDFFEEIAKFRAARRIWAKLMKEKFQAKNPKSMMLRFHSQTAGSTLTAQEPQNNVVRVTLQALSSVLGGTQSLHTNSLDEALALPTEETAKLALRTQQVIAYESNVTQTVDPLAGSYFIENLTHKIEQEVFRYLKEIEEKGGTVQCIESGYIQNEILNSAYSDQRKIDTHEIKIVGMNCFTEGAQTAAPLKLMKVSAEAEEKALKRVAQYKKTRDLTQVQSALNHLKQAAQSDANMMAEILVAVKSGCTLGEISDVLRSVFGEFKEYAGF